eukprot:361095-Alexandrium_andersonii.AAC.1
MCAQALAAHAGPRCPDGGHADPRTKACSNDGFAIIGTRGRRRDSVALHAQRWLGTRGGGATLHEQAGQLH